MSVNPQPQAQITVEKKPVLTWGDWMKTPTGIITIIVIVLLIAGAGYWYSQRNTTDVDVNIDASPELPTSGRTGSNITVTKLRGGYY
jgi:hypothetical protein